MLILKDDHVQFKVNAVMCRLPLQFAKCYINNECRDTGDADPTNADFVCAPNRNPVGWSNAFGKYDFVCFGSMLVLQVLAPFTFVPGQVHIIARGKLCRLGIPARIGHVIDNCDCSLNKVSN